MINFFIRKETILKNGNIMTYVMSDIHGEYQKYKEMLEKINFSDDDILYVLGDVIDRGDNSVEILTDMSMRANVYPIYGNHELMASVVLHSLLVEITDESVELGLDADTMRALMVWQENGGDKTLKGFKRLSPDEREALLEYLDEFSLYEVAEVGERTFILVHSGLGNFSEKKKLSEYTPDELAFMRPDYDRRYFSDGNIFIVAGHTPTPLLSGKKEIFHMNNNICIDCGATFGGKLACLRLEDMAEFYV